MPGGTIQDSRDPNSPQFGYLEIEEKDFEDYVKHKEGRHLDKGAEEKQPGARPWNRYVLFVNSQVPERLFKGDRVEFEMQEVEILKTRTWVAVVTEKCN